MTKMKKMITALLAANLCLPYYAAAENNSAAAEETDGITVYSLYPTKYSVDEFFAMMDNSDMNGVEVGDRALLNDKKNCYWLQTIPENPNGISIESLSMFLYKDSNTGATHFCYENKVTLEDKIVRFTGNDGGLGVTSLALGDLDNDGWNEIYFTYSWDPGTYCSQAGYFDTKTSEVYYFGDHMCPDSELVFTLENDTLSICRAELTHYEDKAHFELEAGESIAEIVCSGGEIELAPLSDDFAALEEKLEPTEKPLPDWIPENADEAQAFMEENGIVRVGSGETSTVIRDNMVCSMICIYSFDSYRGYQICLSEKSDVNAPVSYNKYKDQYWNEYIVACFEMPPDSYLEIYDSAYKSNPHYSYISDENGDVNEGVRGDVNKDGEINIADLVLLQKWLVGNSDDLGCWQLADLCDDNQIDVFDMAMLRRLLVEKR